MSLSLLLSCINGTIINLIIVPFQFHLAIVVRHNVSIISVSLISVLFVNSYQVMSYKCHMFKHCHIFKHYNLFNQYFVKVLLKYFKILDLRLMNTTKTSRLDKYKKVVGSPCYVCPLINNHSYCSLLPTNHFPRDQQAK